MMETSDWSMEVMNLRVVSKSALEKYGGLFAIMDGTIQMLKLCAVNLATLLLEPGHLVFLPLDKELGLSTLIMLPALAVRGGLPPALSQLQAVHTSKMPVFNVVNWRVRIGYP